jgi:hypothetical protein
MPTPPVIRRPESRPSFVEAWDRLGDPYKQAKEEAEELAEAPVLVTRPGEEPDMPDDVTALPSQEVGRLYGLYTAMACYYDSLATEAEVQATIAESYRDQLIASVRLTKSGTVADKDSKTTSDDRVIQATHDLLRATAKAKLLRSMCRGQERFANVLSREITRREPGRQVLLLPRWQTTKRLSGSLRRPTRTD